MIINKQLNKTELEQIIGVDEYSLVICEKSEAAKKISEALSNNNYKTFKIFNIDVFVVRYNKRNYCLVKVCNCKLKDYEKGCVKVEDLLSRISLWSQPFIK